MIIWDRKVQLDYQRHAEFFSSKESPWESFGPLDSIFDCHQDADPP